jgi:TrmH family RNA methyltransferase
MGSVFAMPLAMRATVAEFVKWQKAAGVQLAATHLAGAVDYRTIDYSQEARRSA